MGIRASRKPDLPRCTAAPVFAQRLWCRRKMSASLRPLRMHANTVPVLLEVGLEAVETIFCCIAPKASTKIAYIGAWHLK